MKQQKVRKTTIRWAVENLIKKRGQIAGHKVVDFIYTLKSAAGYSRDDVEDATEIVLEKLMAEGTLHFTIRNAKLLRLTAEPKKADHQSVDNAETQRLEKAIITTYSLKGITMTDDDISGKEVPIMKDLYSVLETMDGAKGICERLEKYVTGIFSGVFSESTNINL